MKLIILILLVIFSTTSKAQVEKKVLISLPDSNYLEYFGNELDSTISQYYDGTVITSIGILPDSLKSYDAVFICGKRYGENLDTALKAKVYQISSYLEGGGNVFFDVSFIDNLNSISSSDSSLTDSFYVFYDYTGIEEIAHAYFFFSKITEIAGVNGTFSSEFRVKNTYNPLISFEYAFEIYGNMYPVLKAIASPSYSIAWAYESGNHKSVVHWDISDDHFPTFIGLVLCNYFNLCTPLAVANDIASASFQITNPRYVRDRNELLFTYESPSVTKFDVSVYSILGERVYYSYDNDAGSTKGEMRIRLNGYLASGGYFLVVKTPDGVARKPFFVVN